MRRQRCRARVPGGKDFLAAARLMLNNVVPFFQPVVCINTRDILGHEVLGRQKTLEGSFESLGPFFHDYRKTSQEKLEVDRVIRAMALEEMVERGSETVLFINIQPQWIYQYKDYRGRLPTLELMEHYGIPGSRVVIEISESEFVGDIGLLAGLVSRYRQAGCRIAIDDLGSGFSNIDRIIHLRPDFLKIDAGLVQHSCREEVSSCLLDSLGRFAQRIGMDLIYEGVENREQLAAGLNAGARYYQGYFFSCPGPQIMGRKDISKDIELDLQNRVSEECNIIEQRQELSREFNRFIQEFLRGKKGLDSLVCPREFLQALAAAALPREWSRLYICDEKGFQRTPNYARGPRGKWQVYPEYTGRYWGWRPYFSPIMAGSRKSREGVLSEPYFDLETCREVSTFCCPLDEHSYLFIDCHLEDLPGGYPKKNRNPGGLPKKK